MKVRLGFLVLALLIGIVGKLGFGDWGEPESATSSRGSGSTTKAAASTNQPSSSQSGVSGSERLHSDALVPPAPVAGVAASAPSFSASTTTDHRAVFEPHGEQVCASGCAVSRHPTAELTQPILRQLLEQFADEPINENSQALETLLFYGRQTAEMLPRDGVASLDQQRVSFLRKELSRAHAIISIRVVDETGILRSSLPPTRVPLDRRHVFSMDVNNIQPLVTSGTVKRVGLYHLWTRL